MLRCFSLSALTLLVGRLEGHPACKTLGVDGDDLTGAEHVVLDSNKIQNGDILVPANPWKSGKRLSKRSEKYVAT